MFVTRLKIAAVLLFGMTLLAVGGESPQRQEKAKGGDKKDAKPVPVKVVKPKKGGLPLMVTYSAEGVAWQQQQIGPLVSGTVKEVLVDIGDRVKKGQTLLTLDAPLLVREVEQATAALHLAEAEVEEAKAPVVIANEERDLTRKSTQPGLNAPGLHWKQRRPE